MKIGLSRLLLLCSLAAAATLAVAALLTRGSNALNLISGQAAPLRPDLIARVDTFSLAAGYLARGEVREILVTGSGLFILHSRQWLRLENGVVHGPYGVGTGGAPGALRDAVDMVTLDSSVFVLERSTKSIVEYSSTGVYRRRISIPADTSFMRSEHLEASQAGTLPGTLYVLAHATTASALMEWRLYKLEAGNFRLMLALDSAVTGNTPQDLSMRAAGADTLIIGFGLPYRLVRYSAAQPVHRIVRADPPLYAIPDSVRQSYSRQTATLTSDVRKRIRLPDHIPPLIDFALLPDGSFVVVRAHGLDQGDVEIIDYRGLPVAQVAELPFDLPIFPFPGGFVTLDHEANRLVILVHRFDSRGTNARD